LRIAYITMEEILGSSNTGGIHCSNRNLYLLRQAFGEENVFVCAITMHREFVPSANGNVAAFFSNRSKMKYLLRNTLQSRVMFGKKLENQILAHITQLRCDVVFLECSKMGLLQKRLPKDMKQILFMHDIELDFLENRISEEPIRIFQYPAIKRNESLAVKTADVIISLNKRDDEQLKRYYRRASDLILPMTMDDTFVQVDIGARSASSKLQLLFVGSFMASNENGVTWFVNEVMPHVSAEFTVVGKGFERLATKLTRNNVKIIGTVEDLSQHYHNANAIVSPILFGSGMKVKTAEAFMYGKPTFATDEALEGYEVEGLRNIYRCNTAQEFVEAINVYAENPQYIYFDENIRTLFLEKYHTQNYVPMLRERLRKT